MLIFYKFVLYVIMVIMYKDKNYLLEVKKMIEEVKNFKSYFLKLYKFREWLGNYLGVKCLILNLFINLKFNIGVDEIEVVDDFDVLLKFLKGIIFGCNMWLYCGIIFIDVCDYM